MRAFSFASAHLLRRILVISSISSGIFAEKQTETMVCIFCYLIPCLCIFGMWFARVMEKPGEKHKGTKSGHRYVYNWPSYMHDDVRYMSFREFTPALADKN